MPSPPHPHTNLPAPTKGEQLLALTFPLLYLTCGGGLTPGRLGGGRAAGDWGLWSAALASCREAEDLLRDLSRLPLPKIRLEQALPRRRAAQPYTGGRTPAKSHLP